MKIIIQLFYQSCTYKNKSDVMINHAFKNIYMDMENICML